MAIVEQTDATPPQREIREVNAGPRSFDTPRCTGRLSPTTPNRSFTHRRHRHLAPFDGQTVHASHVDDSALVAGVNNRVQLGRAGFRNHQGGGRSQLAGVTAVDPAHLDRRRRHHRTRHRHSPGYPAAGPHPDQRSLCRRSRHHPGRSPSATVLGGAHLTVRRQGGGRAPFTHQTRARKPRYATALGAFVEVKNSNVVSTAQRTRLMLMTLTSASNTSPYSYENYKQNLSNINHTHSGPKNHTRHKWQWRSWRNRRSQQTRNKCNEHSISHQTP